MNLVQRDSFRSASDVVCDRDLAERAFHLVLQLADEIIDASHAPDIPADSPAGLSEPSGPARGIGGESGTALFFAALAQATCKPKYYTALHAHMKRAAEVNTLASTGLFSGLDGVLAASRYASLVEPRYRAFSERCALTLSHMDRGSSDHAEPATMFYEYDLVAGSAGKAIASGRLYLDAPADADRSRRMCDHLVWLLSDPERWRCPHPRFRNGASWNDLGMAHGVAGMIAALSLVAPEEDAYLGAIRNGCEFLLNHRYPKERLNWPASVNGHKTQPSRTAWCYGSPGCAAALYMASRKLGDRRYEGVAMEALRQVCISPIEEWAVKDYALCHGFAGNALIFLRIGLCAGDSLLVSTAVKLLQRIVEAYDADIPFGYSPENGGASAISATLLTGSAGIALTLLTAAGYCDPSWVCYFGLP